MSTLAPATCQIILRRHFSKFLPTANCVSIFLDFLNRSEQTFVDVLSVAAGWLASFATHIALNAASSLLLAGATTFYCSGRIRRLVNLYDL